MFSMSESADLIRQPKKSSQQEIMIHKFLKSKPEVVD